MHVLDLDVRELKEKEWVFYCCATGWVGVVEAFTLPLMYENSSQTGSQECDNVLNRK